MRQHTFCIEVNEGQRSHAKRNVQTQVKSAVWENISRYVNGENVLGCVAYKNKSTYSMCMCEIMMVSSFQGFYKCQILAFSVFFGNY